LLPFLTRNVSRELLFAVGFRFPILAAMAARRSAGVLCAIVANVAFAVALTTAGCIAKGDPPGSASVDGSTGGNGGGAGGASGSTISCNPTAGGCLCIADDEQPGQLTDCGPGSVAQNALEQGVCCTAVSLCTCLRYTCRSDPASSYCQCGSVVDLASVTLGTQVAECPVPTEAQKCCFSPDNHMCICSRVAACAAEEMQVSSCSAAVAGACNSGEEIAACR
jgi:hypothetical protein